MIAFYKFTGQAIIRKEEKKLESEVPKGQELLIKEF